MAGQPQHQAHGSNDGGRPPWPWRGHADIDVELKPAGAGNPLLSLTTPDAAARCAYRLLLHQGGEDLLYHLQQHLHALSRAVFLRRVTSVRN